MDVTQKTYRDLEVDLNGSGGIHISQEDEESTGEFDLGVTVEPAAVPALVKALRALARESKAR